MSSRVQVHQIGRRRAWAVWMVAVAVYFVAVFHRSSLGVAGLLAADRFDITASSLAVFTVLQLLVYAAMQIPVGVLLDRYGSRALLLLGMTMMTLGQFAFAFVDSFGLAVLARAVLGAGDAMVFVSVIRLAGVWFSPRQVPMVTQMTGLVGQLGAIVAAAPLTLLLNHYGWTGAFGAASAIGMVLIVAVAWVVKDSPWRKPTEEPIRLGELARSIRELWAVPGTRLALWNHFVSPFGVTVFGLLWGFPFLVRGQGWSETEAGVLLMAMTVWAVVTGLVLGALVARMPYWRSAIVLGVVVAMAVCWAAVLARSTPAPVWLMVLTAFATSAGGPASVVGFDLARSFVPPSAMGRVNGIVNVGGFVSALSVMGLVGVILDLRNPGGMDAYGLDDFRVALSVQFVFWGVGIVQVIRYRRLALADLEQRFPGSLASMRAGTPFVHPELPGR